MYTVGWLLAKGFPFITSTGLLPSVSSPMLSEGWLVVETFPSFFKYIQFLTCEFSDDWWDLNSGEKFLHINYIHRFAPLTALSHVGWGLTYTESFPSFITSKAFFFYVNSVMHNQGWFLAGFFILMTCVRILPCVNSLIDSKAWFTAEGFPTMPTCIRFSPYMHPMMYWKGLIC